MSDAVPQVGSQFGPYQLCGWASGMGGFYEAEDTRKHRVVALRLIAAVLQNNAVFRARMQRGAEHRPTSGHVVPI